jgi:hypothetical protein
MENIKEKIKNIFKENFYREPDEKEINNFYDDLLLKTKKEYSKIDGFAEKNLEERIRSKERDESELEIVFSPTFINKEINQSIKRIGIYVLENSKKYKRLYEMTNALCLALAIKKIYNEEWMIKPQDNPDILFIKRNDNNFNKKPFDVISLEVMQIPEQVMKNFDNNIEEKMAEFIKEKKFNKRYGNLTHLLVHLNFNYMGFKLKKLSDKLCSFEGNPFPQIWIRTNTEPSSKTINISMVYPEYSTTEINLEKENFYY